MWGKTEIECLAWAYVTGLARAGGDSWEAEITPKEAWEVIADSEKGWMHEIRNLAGDRPYERYVEWWDMIANQLKSAEGAFEVGGLAWTKFSWQNAQVELPPNGGSKSNSGAVGG